MNFWKRVRVYLVGVGIGLIFSIYIFWNRGCSWTPTNRVKRTVFSGYVYTSDSLKCVLDCAQTDSLEVYNFINDADIDFSLSETQADPKVYHLSHKGDIMKLAIKDTTSYIKSWDLLTNKCDCKSLSPEPVLVLYPQRY